MERMVPGLSPRHIEADHVQRYLWAAGRLRGCDVVLDYCCGSGYGAHILAGSCARVYGCDKAVSGLASVDRVTFSAVPWAGDIYDVAVFFEAVEHLENPAYHLRYLAEKAHRLLISTPNRNVTSPDGKVNNPHHVREYDIFELRGLLSECGWVVDGMFGQRWQLVPKRRFVRKAYKRLFRPWERTSPKVALWGPWYPEIQPEYLVVSAHRRVV